MKNAIIGIIGGFVIIYVTVISLSIYAKSVRENELNCTVSAVMKQTLKQNVRQEGELEQWGQKAVVQVKEQLEPKTDAEVSEQLVQEITRRLSSESEVQVDVKVCDMERGIISATVKEEFSYPNGKLGTAYLSKTIIVDHKVVEESEQARESPKSDITEITEETKETKEIDDTKEPDAIWEQPIQFYEKYGKELVFYPTNGSNGMIYCATKEDYLPHHYRLLGWKAEIRSRDNQELIQNLFFQLGSRSMKLVKRSYDADCSNEYITYGLSTVNLRTKFNDKAQDLLRQGKCQITFQGCIAPVEGEIAEGTIDDAGEITGKVCTSLDEIREADWWIESEKQEIEEYYEKEVRNLFHTVSLVPGEGIEAVSGNGVYFHGIEVEIDAVLQPGYDFQYWYWKEKEIEKKFAVKVVENMEWSATATPHKEPDIPKPDEKKKRKKLRFISKKYFEKDNQDLILEENGGLSEDSCWAVYPDYRELLRKALSEESC